MKRQLSLLFVVISFLFSFILLGFSGYEQGSVDKNIEPADSEPAVKIGMTNTMKFDPDTVEIEVGQTVRWVNSSLLAHSVTADPEEATLEGSVSLPDKAEPFDSGMMDPEQTFEHTFKHPGKYVYFCIPHEGANMRGVIIVR